MPGPALSVAFYRYIIPDLYLLYRLAGTFGKERAQAVYADSAHLSLIQQIAAVVHGIQHQAARCLAYVGYLAVCVYCPASGWNSLN